MATFPPLVERWRPLVKKYFRPEEVDKALHVIFYESSGLPDAIGPGGGAVGLFQLHTGGVGAGMSVESRKDAETNIRVAAEAVRRNGWRDWGENNSYNGEPFGALGLHPFEGSSGGSTMAQTAFDFPVSQGYGPTDEPLDSGYRGYAHFNKGIDYAAPEGTPVPSIVGGTVIQAGPGNDGWGVSVKIRDAQGNVHNYGHLSAANVSVGQQVGAGDVVGATGNTGASTGPHLSYDVLSADGEYIDPSPFLSNRGAVNGRAYYNQTPQGGGAGVPGMNSGIEAQIAALSAKLAALIQAGPQKDPDGTYSDIEMEDNWVGQISEIAKTIGLLKKNFSDSTGGSGIDPAQQEFENKMAEYSAGIAYDNLNLDRASRAITAFLGGQAESRARADLKAKAQEQVTEWGTAPGKTDYSFNDLGSGFGQLYGGLLGLDPSSSLISYSGTQNLDPMGDLLAGDTALGVNGPRPGIPELITQPGGRPSWVGVPAGGGTSTGSGVPPTNGSAATSSIPLPEQAWTPPAAATTEYPAPDANWLPPLDVQLLPSGPAPATSWPMSLLPPGGVPASTPWPYSVMDESPHSEPSRPIWLEDKKRIKKPGTPFYLR